jgi:WD40 repeat protein
MCKGVGKGDFSRGFDATLPSGAVNSLAVHPSGKLALSVGRDKTLRVWNLLVGKPAFTTTRPVGVLPAPQVVWLLCAGT